MPCVYLVYLELSFLLQILVYCLVIEALSFCVVLACLSFVLSWITRASSTLPAWWLHGVINLLTDHQSLLEDWTSKCTQFISLQLKMILMDGCEAFTF